MIDSKHYRGRLRVDRDGMVWHGRRLLVSALRTTLWEAEQADEVLGIADLQVPAIAAVHGASMVPASCQAERAVMHRRGLGRLTGCLATTHSSFLLATVNAPGWSDFDSGDQVGPPNPAGYAASCTHP